MKIRVDSYHEDEIERGILAYIKGKDTADKTRHREKNQEQEIKR